MKKFVELPKLQPGDQVAVVSPSGDAAGRFPWVYELGLERLEKDFGLKSKEFPTTRQIGASHEEKAKDLMDAFADPDNKAVLATTDEQLLELSRYIHNQAIKLNQPCSYPEYLGKRKTEWVKPQEVLEFFSKKNPNLSYQSFIEKSENKKLPESNLTIDGETEH